MDKILHFVHRTDTSIEDSLDLLSQNQWFMDNFEPPDGCKAEDWMP